MGLKLGFHLSCRLWRCSVAAAVLVACVFVPRIPADAGPAINQFEMKDLEAEPGELEFQSQNAHSWGQPRRRIARDEDGELVYDDNSVVDRRHALEMEMSLTRYFRMRVGIEYERERLEDPAFPAQANDFGHLNFDEVALEGVVIAVPVPKQGGVGLGFLAEYQHPTEGGELNSIVFGPIVQAVYGPWSAIGNFTFVKFFGDGEVTDEGLERDEKWDFAYGAQLAYEYSENWTFALEAYGTIDRLGDTGSPGEERALFGDHDLHRMGPLIYYSFTPGSGRTARMSGAAGGGAVHATDDEDDDDDEDIVVTLGTGLLVGLNENTPDTTLKWSVEVEF